MQEGVKNKHKKMLNHRNYNPQRINATSLILDRQSFPIDTYVARRLQSSSGFIDRLELEAVLNGHHGCVNCIEWSRDGRILASGSDDMRVILWDPFKKCAIHKLRTEHLGNVFSVKFLPGHNDSWIATCAADRYVYVYDIHRSGEALFACHCHTSRVKRLATSLDSPNIFWSAAEDGFIFQLDIREPHVCSSEEVSVDLINLNPYLDINAEAKCIAVNPMRTEYLAVGANDPYARIYDRRMLKKGTSSEVPKDCVTFFCPGHINKNNSKFVEHESRTITYLTFDATGTDLLVNMGGEHIYLYDVINGKQPIYLNLPDPEPTTVDEESALNATDVTSGENPSSTEKPATISKNRRKLPEHIETYKKMGNEFLENEKYLRAIDQYSEAIALAPQCAVLYLNRATAFMRRAWFGDVYDALRDCHEALRLDPSYIKAQFRLARALLDLGRVNDAEECLKELINRFPNYANNHGVLMLHKDIKESRQTKQSNQQATEAYNCLEVSDMEYQWRSKAKDYSKRFVGHCNTTTDIKEANFFGREAEFIVAGSDDGNFFIWERKTGIIRSVYKADAAIVNCVQPHPHICMLATSGIDNNVKIWSPIAESLDKRSNLVSYRDKTVEENQKKMKTDPFDLHTRNAFCWSG